ncbi:fringe glycosyltransferase-like [Haliotis rufescens]|uniref:fringe glycosyltransferase-like n=1 Tax=Haliotis rufescens TaxID=6454 RepID=UPI001EAFB70B|nr:fringe glycosyltransferase-like [Haliotis rufescens]
MRLSLRSAVKLTAFVVFILFANILLFAHYDELADAYRGKVGDSPSKVQVNNGGNQRPVEDGFKNIDFHRKQRSAKSIPEEVQKAVNAGGVTRNGVLDNRLLFKHRQHRRTELSDIFISVKTSKKYHESRVGVILKTWFTLVREQTYFFTDSEDKNFQDRTGGHMINTNCSSTHNRQALCCKMALEYDTFMDSNKRWFCHVDDDTYVNIPQLLKLLQGYNHTQDWYLGKPSLRHPIEIMDRDHPGQKLAYWFATGGAGFCISKGLALKMMPHASGGRLMTVGDKIRLPDDCTVGYIINYILKKDLTVIDGFHSHLEALWLIRSNDLLKQITFSYSQYSGKMNVVNVPGLSDQEDPTRFRSLHCYLFPTFRECKDISS